MRQMTGKVGEGNEKSGSFFQEVYRAVSQIPRGRVSTYGDIAKAIGVSGGARAVGLAMAKNKDIRTVPCHRVVLGDGRVGGYSGGTIKKISMLGREGLKVSTATRTIQDFQRVKFRSFRTK